MTFKVMAERCDQCLFSKNKIVSKERKAEIIREITSGQGSWFHCHKTSGVACRGDWDKYGCGNLGRVMGRLGAVEFVTLPALPSTMHQAIEKTEGGASIYCANCDHEHPLHEDARGFHHVIRGERVPCCSVSSTDGSGK